VLVVLLGAVTAGVDFAAGTARRGRSFAAVNATGLAFDVPFAGLPGLFGGILRLDGARLRLT
jgi:hypothetical protein